MDYAVKLIGDVGVAFFNLLIYMQLTVCKKEGFQPRFIMYLTGALSIGAFLIVEYNKWLPESSASAICITLPTFLVFFILSKYKDCRFLVTFCFLDTITYMLVFYARAATVLLGTWAGAIVTVVVIALMCFIYFKGKPFFRNYRELLVNVKEGWVSMAITTMLVYVLLVFAAAYPVPMIDRPEYFLVYALLTVTVISFYTVYFTTIYQKKKLADLNARFVKEKKWHRIAYSDALTETGNRMAYIETINEFERTVDRNTDIFAIMIDIDNFKRINDTFGHHTGDLVLKSAADKIRDSFPKGSSYVFRIGGDEFAVVAYQISADDLEQKLSDLRSIISCAGASISLSLGCSKVDFTQKNALENAFIRADAEMYKEKNGKPN